MVALEAVAHVHVSSIFIDWTIALSCMVFEEHTVR